MEATPRICREMWIYTQGLINMRPSNTQIVSVIHLKKNNRFTEYNLVALLAEKMFRNNKISLLRQQRENQYLLVFYRV